MNTINSIFVCGGGWVGIRGSQRITYRSWFSPPTLEVPEIILR